MKKTKETIAIVGNGELSKNYGKEIDKADIVIRINGAKIDGFEKKIGKRTDILCLVGETALSYKRAFGNIDKKVLNDADSIIFSGKKKNPEYEKTLGKEMYIYMGPEIYTKLCKKIDKLLVLDKLPSTGINLLCHYYMLYKYDDTKINVYGFDCFETGHYYAVNDRKPGQFHNLDMESKLIKMFGKNKNISFFN